MCLTLTWPWHWHKYCKTQGQLKATLIFIYLTEEVYLDMGFIVDTLSKQPFTNRWMVIVLDVSIYKSMFYDQQ